MKSFKQLREECGCKDKERKTKSKKTVEVMPQVKDGSGMKIGVKEEAPSGKKYERMIKHIKRSYAKDGKLTKDEKSIAYATAWKHKNKNKQLRSLCTITMLAFLLPLAAKIVKDAVAKVPDNEELGEKLVEICLLVLKKAVKLTKTDMDDQLLEVVEKAIAAREEAPAE